MKRTQLRSHKKKNSLPENETFCFMNSPVGEILLVGNQEGLKLISFQKGAHPIEPNPQWIYDEKPFKEVKQQLRKYFQGTLQSFTLKLAPEGTPFQQRVWKALKQIPYGKTVSYGAIAKAIGKPSASRAVGAANGQNPLSIIVPCHRVIGCTGRMVGYGGGISIKETLLDFEFRHSSPKNKRASSS